MKHGCFHVQLSQETTVEKEKTYPRLNAARELIDERKKRVIDPRFSSNNRVTPSLSFLPPPFARAKNDSTVAAAPDLFHPTFRNQKKKPLVGWKETTSSSSFPSVSIF